MKLNLDYLLLSLWEHLNLIRVYTKKPGNKKHQTLKSKTNTNRIFHLANKTLNYLVKCLG